MTAAVVDASFAGAWVLPDEASAPAERVLRKVLQAGANLAAPDLWSYEMCNLLVMACRRRRLSQAQAFEGAALLHDLPIVFHDHHEPLARRRTLTFAIRFTLSAYDAAYLELADRLQCPLLTGDGALQAAATAIGLAQRLP